MAAPGNEGIPQDLTSVQWRSVEWVTAFGALTPTTVLDYFAQSPFYDPTSNNAVLRMQTQYSVEAGSGFNEAEELKRFVGVEFAVSRAEPPNLFVIEKRDRKSPTEAQTIAAYYVLHNSIYQAPDLYSVVANRLLSSLFYMQSSLTSARDKKTDFTPRTGGNRYRVLNATSVEEKAALVAASAGDKGNEGVNGEKPAEDQTKGKSEKKTAKSGAGNLDFLLARAVHTATQRQQQQQER